MLKVLNPVIPITANEISESIIEMKELDNINSENLTIDNSTLNLAEWNQELIQIHVKPINFVKDNL